MFTNYFFPFVNCFECFAYFSNDLFLINLKKTLICSGY